MLSVDIVYIKTLINKVLFFNDWLFYLSTVIANKLIFFRFVGKVIDNNDDAALLEEREELVERQDLGMRQRIRIKILSIHL